MTQNYVQESNIIVLIFLLLLFSGCSSKNPEGRVDVIGTITLNGKIIEGAAAVVLSPVNGSNDDGGRSPVLNGKFHFTKRSAPKPGKYIVRIYSVQEFDTVTKKSIMVNGVRQLQGAIYLAKVIPDEFNVNSKIELEVRDGWRKNVFNYDVVTNFEPEPIEGRR